MHRFRRFTPNEIKPAGWLKRQLRIQADGLGGRLDEVWRDVRDSAWIGGSAEGWERVPYWLDGFIPLAFLLEDGGMIARAKRYIDAILASQKPSGWICPHPEEDAADYDSWAILLISKALTVWARCSGDERADAALYKLLKNYHALLSSGAVKLFDWGAYRWFEGCVAIEYIYSRRPETWLKELAALLREQGVKWAEKTPLWEAPAEAWNYDTHIVNVAMALKAEAVSHELLGEEYSGEADRFLDILDRFNGTPAGVFTGDEILSGLSPIQGTELCAVAELMYSCEQLYARTGAEKWAERLELIAFNAFPAAFSDDMWAHQYDQQSNQIACERFPGRPVFRTNNCEAHLFGLEPNYGCCTANFGQGWPKLALSAFMRGEGEVVSAVPVPSRLDCDICRIELETDYPFDTEFVYTVEAKAPFALALRAPSYAGAAFVDGAAVTPEADGLFRVRFAAGERRVLRVRWEVGTELLRRPHGLVSVKRGPLVFALPIAYEKRMREYERDGVERKYPYCDYEYLPKSEWRYALADGFEFDFRGVGETPFSSARPPVALKAKARRVDWGFEEGYTSVCAKEPRSRVPFGEAVPVGLVPYGCAKLRVTELPLIR